MAQTEDVANGAVEERGVRDDGGVKGPVGHADELGERGDQG
ncbi:MAG: hypothetical protein QOG76_1278, partial [Pseudonocardiales bacterium]|nr:hypothetical protein [Pseudonocardiales bacterium]